MAERNIISSPSIQDTEVLCVIYLGLVGNGEKTSEDFYEFLSVDTLDRSLFLDKYCDYSLETRNEQTILIYRRKSDANN